MTPLTLTKAHAYGNDFLLLETGRTGSERLDAVDLARRACARHAGIGADGLILFSTTAAGADMRLLNADGSRAEISGNGLRCLAALLAHRRALAPGGQIDIDTDAGRKQLELLERAGGRCTFRAAMGEPERIERRSIRVGQSDVDAVTLRVGNPQCVVLGEVNEERLHRIAAPLAVHSVFPEGTNVELASVESPRVVRILIWERGVGPTEASGTGACAAAVAAMRYGGADRDVEVVSPGGAQRVEWLADGLYLTGWAELIAEAQWLQR
jgi:diaminopimelate epimerase